VAAKKKGGGADYAGRVRAFEEAVNLGIETYGASKPPRGEPRASVADYAKHARQLAQMARTAKGPMASMRSLSSLEEAFFGYWNEAQGPHVEQFWAAIAERGLPFERHDVIREVLERGRIRTLGEYDHVTDGLVLLEEEGRITSAERKKLEQMLAEYEGRHGGRR
jgi:hypothetical protein